MAGLLKPPSSDQGVNQLFLVFSLDLVGSTSYKNGAGSDRIWVQQFLDFFDVIDRRARGKNFKPWKLLGDEILLLKAVGSLAEIEDGVEAAHDLLLFGRNESLIAEIEDLDVKGCCWLLLIDNDRNMQTKQGYLGLNQVDFLGPDVDEGFRVAAHFAKPRRLALSFSLVDILSKSEHLKHHIYCIGYKRMKGIWQNRY